MFYTVYFQWAKNTDPDHTPPLEQCDLGLHLAKTYSVPIFKVYGYTPTSYIFEGEQLLKFSVCIPWQRNPSKMGSSLKEKNENPWKCINSHEGFNTYLIKNGKKKTKKNVNIYSRRSVAKTLMVHLPRPVWTCSWVPCKKNPAAADLEYFRVTLILYWKIRRF